MPVLGRISGDGRRLNDDAAMRLGMADSYRAGVRGATAAQSCGAASCAGSWVPPWRSRTRPVFEQQWGCGSRCLQEMVRAAVRRETGDTIREAGTEPHRHRVPLGLVLLAQGWITHPQLRTALESQRAAGQGRIGDWLVQGCGLEEAQIARGLGVQWNCPVLTMEGFSPKEMALVMPKRFVAEFGVVPLRVGGRSRLYMAFADRMDAVTSLAVEQITGLPVENGLLAGSDFAMARERVLAAEGVPVRTIQQADADGVTDAIVKLLTQSQPVASRLTRVREFYWLRMWQESGAFSGVGSLPSGVEDVQDFLFSTR